MFNVKKRIIGLLFLIFMFTFLWVLSAAPEERSAQQNLPREGGQLPSNPNEALLKLQNVKKAVDQLVAERDELIRKGASQEQIEAKTAELMQAKRDGAELFRNAFPQGLPQTTSPQRPLSEAEQAAVKALIEKRRQMVEAGATHNDIQGITEQIHKIYYGSATPPSLSSPQLKATLLPQRAQSSAGQDQHTHTN